MQAMIKLLKQMFCLHGGNYQACFKDRNGKPECCVLCGKVFNLLKIEQKKERAMK